MTQTSSEHHIDIKKGFEAMADSSGFLTTAELFAGTQVVEHAFSSIEKSCLEQLNVQAKFVHLYAADYDPEVLDFNSKNSKARYLFGRVKELVEPQVHDHRTGRTVLVPHATLLLMGFVCISRSPNNNKAKMNKGCVSKGIEASGEAFHEGLEVIDTHKPQALMLENLKALTAENDGSDEVDPEKQFKSDASFIMGEFGKRGYWIKDFIIDAKDYGSKAKRVRWLALAWMEVVPRPIVGEYRVQVIQNILKEMRISASSFDCLAEDDVVGRPLFKKSRIQDESKFADEHSQLYLSRKLPWPPTPSLKSKFRGMLKIEQRTTQRPFEAMIFCSAAFPFLLKDGWNVDESSCQYADFLPSLPRLVGQDGSRDPWRPFVPTMTTKSIVLRRQLEADGEATYHLLDGSEMMELTGWPMHRISPTWGSYDSVFLQKSSGNAFSGFPIQSLIVAFAGGIGATLTMEEPPPAAQVQEEVDSRSPSPWDESDDSQQL